jgi:hypothetical protein
VISAAAVVSAVVSVVARKVLKSMAYDEAYDKMTNVTMPRLAYEAYEDMAEPAANV